MMLDFTYAMLRQLYEEILCSGYEIIPFLHFLTGETRPKAIILRHDVDNRIGNALKIAVLERDLGIRSSYYIRYRKHLFDSTVLKKIADLGHEIGYHYEDLTAARGDIRKAISRFEVNLARFRALYPVKTICMHGSPFSKWDNRLVWTEYDYHDFGIVGEPYFDIDYNKVLYLTDTGRRWDGVNVNVRDKVRTSYRYSLRSTCDIIDEFRRNSLPDRVMINIHPHSWHDGGLLWLRELVWQGAKNMVKYVLIRRSTPADL
ncbi:MAG: hypothetical protein JSU64_05670 [candidate division WOR-3 bacterium]|nr:MAG: hypothetical protein JSU64_05670 [candidate division WOR-3 bacterium]